MRPILLPSRVYVANIHSPWVYDFVINIVATQCSRIWNDDISCFKSRRVHSLEICLAVTHSDRELEIPSGTVVIEQSAATATHKS